MKGKKLKEYIPTEYEEQKIVIKFLNILKQQRKVVEFHSVPNENLLSNLNRQKAAAVQQILKANGAKSGVPDLFVYLKDKLLIIEMKRRKRGRLSENQKYWLGVLEGLNYIKTFVAYGAEEAINFIQKEING